MFATKHLECRKLVLGHHGTTELETEGDLSLCPNRREVLRLEDEAVTSRVAIRQKVGGTVREMLHDANLHEQTDAVFGNSTATRTTPAHAPGLVPPGSPTHGGECLLKSGLWGQPSIHTGAVSESLLMLNDCPSTYEAAHGHFLRVSASSSVEFVDLAQAIQGTPLDSITVTSDMNAKTGIIPMDLDEAAAAFKGIHPVRFRYLSDPNTDKIGVVAQDVEKVLPSAVTQPDDADGFKRVDYVALVGLLTAALKATTVSQEALLKRVDMLERRLSELGDLVGSIGRADE